MKIVVWTCPFNEDLWVELEILNGKPTLFISDKFLNQDEIDWLGYVMPEVTNLASEVQE